MAHALLDKRESVFGASPDLLTDADEFGQILGPVIAGARARGVADALEMMGVAGVLLDCRGRVLHAGGRAERALLPLVRIVGHHLVGCDSEVNERLQKVLSLALEAKPRTEDVGFFNSDGGLRFSMKAIRVPQDGVPSVQLLHAILVIAERDV